MSGRHSSPETSAGRTADSGLSRASDWLLLNGDRGTVALALAGALLAFFLALAVTDLAPLVDLQALFYVYSGLIAGNVTLVTVVVSINQLLLSRQLQTPGELRSQIEDVIAYRRDVEDATDEVAPVEPMGFLQLLVEAAREEAQRLGGLARNCGGEAFGREIDDEVAAFTDRMDEIDALLRESGGDTIDVLSVLLETNYAREINRLRRLKDRHGEELDDQVAEAIDSLIDRLQEIGVARQYFKTIYLQQELSLLSRRLLYVGVPAVALAMASLLLLTVPSDAPGANLPPA